MKNLIKNQKPWGIILFKRNIKSFDQVKKFNKRYKKMLMKDPFTQLLLMKKVVEFQDYQKLINNKRIFTKIFWRNYLKKIIC